MTDENKSPNSHQIRATTEISAGTGSEKNGANKNINTPSRTPNPLGVKKARKPTTQAKLYDADNITIIELLIVTIPEINR